MSVGKVIGEAVIKVGADASGVGKDIEKDVEKGSHSSVLSSAGSLIGKTVVAGIAAVAAGVGVVFAEGLHEAKITQNMNAQFAAGIKSTGNAAHLSVESMDALANSIANVSGQSVAVVGKTEQILQTFTKVKNVGVDKIFDRTTLAAANMAAKMGGDTSRYALQLGKALGDPVRGMTALQRSGVVFSDSQKSVVAAMVKTGNITGAQKVILKELDTEFGGAAAAAGNTLTGGLNKVHVAFGQISETVVTSIMPIVTPAIQAIAKALIAARPAIEKFIEKAKEFFNGPAFKAGVAVILGLLKAWWAYITTVLIPMIERIAAVAVPILVKIAGFIANTIVPALLSFTTWLGNVVQQWWPLLVAIGAAIVAYEVYQGVMAVITLATEAWAAATAALTAIMDANPVMLIVIAIAALIALVVAAYFKFQWFHDLIDAVWQGIQATIAAVVGWFQNTLVPAFQAVWNAIAVVISVVVAIVRVYLTIWLAIFFTAFNAIKAVVLAVFNWLKPYVTTIIQVVVAVVKTSIGVFMAAWGAVSKIVGIVREAFSGALGAIKSVGGTILGWITTFVGNITKPFTDFVGKMLAIGGQVVSGLWQGIQNGKDWLMGKVMDWIKAVIPGPILQVLGIKSPSKVAAEIMGHFADGMNVGMDQAAPSVASHAVDLAGSAAGGLTAGLAATASTATTTTNQIAVTIEAKSLADLHTVDDFLAMLDKSRTDQRKVLRSGKVNA